MYGQKQIKFVDIKISYELQFYLKQNIFPHPIIQIAILAQDICPDFFGSSLPAFWNCSIVFEIKSFPFFNFQNKGCVKKQYEISYERKYVAEKKVVYFLKLNHEAVINFSKSVTIVIWHICKTSMINGY